MNLNVKEIQLEAACSLTEEKAFNILYQNELSRNELINAAKINFNFDQYDLMSYLRERPQLCEEILSLSYDQRSSPSIFIEKFNRDYRVGFYGNGRKYINIYDKLYEATADFVLFSWNLGRLERNHYKLPKEIRQLSIESGNEIGWRQRDFKKVIEFAKKVPMAILGGQIQYKLDHGTCELYWLNYDSIARNADEAWTSYCNRTASEVSIKFNELITNVDFEKEILAFDFLKEQKSKGIDLEKYKLYILHFEDRDII